MQKTEREIAIDTLMEITSAGAYNNISLRKALVLNATLGAAQKAFVTELVNGTLRNLIYLDHCIGAVSSTPVSKMRPFILNTLRVSAYQILFLDRTPNAAACNEAVKLTKARGFDRLSGFVNGVLRAVTRSAPPLPGDPEQALAIRYSYPPWLMRHFIHELGMDAAARMCAACATPPDVSAAVNTLRTDADRLCAMLEGEGMRARRSALLDDMIHISRSADLSRSDAFRAGLFHVLDESAALAVRVLDPQPGGLMLDVCAAPGGKSLYAAYRTRDACAIRAYDIHAHKIALIDQSAERLGLRSVVSGLADACAYKPELYECADYLLLDAPCSGLGLLRKKPDIKYNKTPEDITALARLQRRMLENCSRYIKPGGVLVYATCTISSAENQEQMRWFAEHFPFEPQDISTLLPGGLACDTTQTGCVQIVTDEHRDGFFIARFRKPGNSTIS